MAARGSFPNSSSTASISFSVGNRTGSRTEPRSPGLPSRLTIDTLSYSPGQPYLFSRTMSRPTKCNARPRAKAKHGSSSKARAREPQPSSASAVRTGIVPAEIIPAAMFVLTFAPKTEAIRYDEENTGWGWKTVAQIPAADTVQPNTCRQLDAVRAS